MNSYERTWGPFALRLHKKLGLWAFGLCFFAYGLGVWLGPLELLVNSYKEITGEGPPVAP